MANSYYEELQKRRAAEEAARKEAAKGYRQAVEAGKNAKSQRENPAVTTTEYTQRQRRAKQAADLFLELTHPVKSNPYLMATANAGMAREQLAQTEKEYDAFLQANQDSSTPPVNLPEAVKLQEKAQTLDSQATYWENQKTAHKERAVMERDMAEFEKWPEEDRELMERYSRGRNMMPLDIGATAAQRKLAEKYGLETLNRMEESYSRSRNQESAEKVSALGRKNATGAVGKVLSSAASVGTSLMSNAAGAMDTLYAVTNDAITGTGRYSSLDPNLQGNLGAVYSGAVRGKVSGDLERQGTAGKVGSVVYQGAMSAADSLARLAVAGEAGSLALAGLGSFGQTVSDVSAKGGNQYQAIGMGVVTAGLEVITEKVSLDNLLTRSKGGYQGAWNAVKDAFAQAGVEVSEEELSFIGSTLAEAAILRDKSDYRQHIGDLVAGGMSYQEAKEEANRGLINEALQTAAVSAVSGGLMSGGASVVNKLTGNVAQPEAAQNMEPAPAEAAPEVGPEAGQEAQKETEAEMKRRTTIEAVREVVGGKSPGQQKEVISIEDYANNKSPVRDVVQGQNHLPESQIYNWGIKKDAPLGGAQPVVSDSSRDASSGVSNNTISETAGNVNRPGANPESSVGAAGDFGRSKTFTNSGLHNANENVREGYRQNLKGDPDAAKYAVKHNADTMKTAKERVSTAEKITAEYDNLMAKDQWEAEDVAVSTLLLDKIMGSGDPDAKQKLNDLRQKRKDIGVGAGQIVQAFSIQDGTMAHAESTTTAVDAAIGQLENLKPEDTTWNPKNFGPDFESWKKSVGDEITNIGIAVEMVEEGDAAQMRDVIRQIANARSTTAWFGATSRLSAGAQRILNKLDFDTLKKVARIQIASMADDYRARNAKDLGLGLRKMNMLKSLKTVGRNLAGNVSVGVLDAMSDSGAGNMADYLLSKVTGKRTVGNDLKYTQEYLAAARDAMQWASLCVELNIPIETDSDSSLSAAMEAAKTGKYIPKTFRANGNLAMRVMYASQKYMSYALEVTDKIFEGGTNAAVRSSLENLKNSNLSDLDVDALSDYVGNRRTFKDATWKDADGKTRGSALSKKATELTNALGTFGEIVNPFVKVPMNVAQTGIDYTAGVAKGVGEIISIIKDAKAGKAIDVVRQRQAASDFGRGVSGVGMVALATAMAAMGVVKADKGGDWDKEALAQAEGRTGAQISWSALYRWLKGESPEWTAEDVITGFDFLEPFNTQLYLGYELAQEDSLKDMLKAYPGATLKSVWSSLMDSPMMTGLSEIVDTVNEFSEDPTLENGKNLLAGYAGDVATSFIPQYVRQIAQHTDGYYRDTSGDTPVEAAINKFKAVIPGQSQTLPMKYSGLGEPQERGGFIGTFIDPTGTTRYKPNAITGYLDQLSERTGDVAIYPERNAPNSFEVNGETVMISGKETTETYQKAYGENVAALYGALMDLDAFRGLSDEMQLKALKKAKNYATAMAKAAVSDYSDVPGGTPEDIAAGIVCDEVTAEFTKAFSNMTDSRKTGKNTANAATELENAYEVFTNLSAEAQNRIRQDASGRVGDFLTAVDAGVDAKTFAGLYQTYYSINTGDAKAAKKANDWAYQLQRAKERGDITAAQLRALKSAMTISSGFTVEAEKFDAMSEAGIRAEKADYVTDLIAAIKPQKGYADVRDIQKAEKIAHTTGLTESERATVMKIYMPAAQDKKLDKMLDLGYSVRDYVTVWQLYDSGKGDGKKARTIAAIREELGCDHNTAKAIYEIYG